MVDQNKLGLYKRMKIEKAQKELDVIQSAGKESIILIAKRLLKELIEQGYNVDSDGDNENKAYLTIHKFRGRIDVEGLGFRIEEEREYNEN